MKAFRHLELELAVVDAGERKLVLNKETLRTLAGDRLAGVVGGVPPDDTDFDSCGRTCTCECNE